MKLIYIAGKYTAPSRCAIMANIQAAREAAAQVALMGAFPVTPHLLGHGLEDAGDEQYLRGFVSAHLVPSGPQWNIVAWFDATHLPKA